MDIEEYAQKHPKSKGAKLSPVIIETIKKLPKGAKILDIGCAEGNTIQELYDTFGDKFYYTGVDLSETRINVAQNKKIPNSEFEVSNGEKTPFENEQFDCVLCSQVLEHVEDEISLLKEISRVLRPNGIFEIDTVFKKKWAWYFYRSPMGWALDPTHLREYTDVDVIRRMFSIVGLKTTITHMDQSYRNLNTISSINLKFPIPGYFIIFIVGEKKPIIPNTDIRKNQT